MSADHSLKRTISCTQGVAISIGAVVGVSILVLPGLTAREAGPVALLSWLLMSILTFPVVLALGCLARRLPNAGGIVAYVSAAFGARAGAMTGWVLLGSVPIGVPTISLIGAHYFATIVPLSDKMCSIMAMSMLMLSILLNVRGIKIASAVQVAVVCTIIFLVVASVASALPHVSLAEFTPFVPHGWFSIGAAIVPIFFCFVGWEMITPLAEEFENPQRDMMKSLMVAAAIISVLYLSVAFVTIGAGAYKGENDIATFSVLIGKTLGSRGSHLTAILAVLVAFASIHVNITGFSRVLYAQARNGYLPTCFSKLHPRFDTPYATLALLGILFSMVVGFYTAFRPNLAHLIKWPSVVFVFAYIVTMASGVRVIPKYDMGWWMSLVSLCVCTVIFLFSGWTALFPIGLFAAGWVVSGRRQVGPASGAPIKPQASTT
jgi:amino acid efflux transporter